MIGTKLSQEEINKNYEGTLLTLVDRLQQTMALQNEFTGTKHGFIMLIIRDPSEGNIDVAHNFTSEKDLINVLNWAVDTVKKGNSTQKSGDK